MERRVSMVRSFLRVRCVEFDLSTMVDKFLGLAAENVGFSNDQTWDVASRSGRTRLALSHVISWLCVAELLSFGRGLCWCDCLKVSIQRLL